jgi:hypothetical protein
VVAVLSDDTVERNVVGAKLFSRWARLSAIFYSLDVARRAGHAGPDPETFGKENAAE